MSIRTPRRNVVFTTQGKSPLTPQCPNMGQTRRTSPKASPKSRSPYKLDRVTSDWTLHGTGPPSISRKINKGQRAGDRFIARTNSSTLSISSHDSKNKNSQVKSADFNELNYSCQLADACGLALNQRILAFKPEAPLSRNSTSLTSQYNRPLTSNSSQKSKRRINTVPERVLDAPGLVDDYYLNLLDWSTSNCVAVALERTVYVWNAQNGSVDALLECADNDYITSVRWAADGLHLGVGLSDGKVQIFDSETGTKTRSLHGQQARVAALSWNSHMLSSGARNGLIQNSDVRIKAHHVSTFKNHVSEVCGLTWREDGQQLASGGNDNMVNIWDIRSTVPKFSKTNHTAAVKALAWCPWNASLLATGGGSSDRKINFFSSTTGSRLATTQCTSQVTSLTWSPSHRELVSTHGFPDNQLTVHSFSQNSLDKIVDIPAHDSRILHATLSPDGTTLATTSSDENLKFWKVFEARKKSTELERGTKSMDSTGMTIR